MEKDLEILVNEIDQIREKMDRVVQKVDPNTRNLPWLDDKGSHWPYHRLGNCHSQSHPGFPGR